MRQAIFLLILMLVTRFGISQETAKVELRVIVDKKTITQGEIINASISVLVSDSNRARVQFIDPQHYLSLLLPEIQKNSFFRNTYLENIYGRQFRDLKDSYTRYDIYEGYFHPIDTGIFELPSLSFPLNHLPDSTSTNQEEKLLVLKSEPVRIRVSPTLSRKPYDKIFSSKLKLDTLLSSGVNSSDLMRIRIQGEGIGLPVEIPKYIMQEIGEIEKIEYKDSIDTKENIYFEKIFTINKKHKDSTNLKVLILADVSKSMWVEDYLPNRLTHSTNLIEGLIDKYPNSEVLGYAGSIKTLSKSDLKDSLILKAIPDRGTSLGNAVFLSLQTLSTQKSPATLIIIGDGDSTSGNISITDALSYFDLKKMKVVVIGIGQKGPAPYGFDDEGKRNYVENTFNDYELRLITNKLYGKYIHYRHTDNTADIIDQIHGYLKGKN